MIDKPQVKLLTFDGALGIANADAIRETLLAAMSEADTVEIDCDAATTIDISFIQLLIGAQRQGTVRLKTPLPEALVAALARGGFPTECHNGIPLFLTEGE